jgi:hypothetical protein
MDTIPKFINIFNYHRGPLSLVSTIEELLERKSSDSSAENEMAVGDLSR